MNKFYNVREREKRDKGNEKKRIYEFVKFADMSGKKLIVITQMIIQFKSL